MYLLTVVLLMVILPSVSVGIESFQSGVAVTALIGKWFVFWLVGVRLLLAGLRQFFQPAFTAQTIFEIRGGEAYPVVRELGVANISLGVGGIATLIIPSSVVPIALVGMVFYGIVGIRHVANSPRTPHENVAMVSDLFAAAILAWFLVSVWFR